MTSLGRYSALGATFELRASGQLAKVLRAACVDLRVEESAARTAAATQGPEHLLEVVRRGLGRWDVRCDGDPRSIGVAASDALRDALAAISGLARSAAIATDTVLDAGAVEIDGVAVGFVGPGGARTSGFTAAAALRGCGYIADDVLAVDADGQVRPFHRPITLRHRGIESLALDVPRGPFSSCYPLRLGARTTLSDGAMLGLLVLVERNGVTSLQPMPEPLALARLANQVIEAAGNERIMFARLDRLVRRVPVVTMAYADLDGAVAAARAVLAERR